MTRQLAVTSIRNRLLRILSITAAAWGVRIHAHTGAAGRTAQVPARLRIGHGKPAAAGPAAGGQLSHTLWPEAACCGPRPAPD